MAYTNPQDVRDLLGVSIDEADDEILSEFINYAQLYIRKYIQIEVYDGKLSGNINAKNNTFTTDYAFWADISGNTVITTADFTVYGWKKDFENDQFKKEELSVSTFDPLRGKVLLSSAPSNEVYGKVTMDYSYYTKKIDWQLLSLVTAWKAAELWVKREEFLVPETYVFGSKRITQRQPWKYYELEVRRLVNKIIALPMTKVAYARLVFRPRGSRGPEVKSTGAEEIGRTAQYQPDPEIADIVDNAEKT